MEQLFLVLKDSVSPVVTALLAGAGAAFPAVRWSVAKYLKKIEETETKVADLQRTYVSRTELETYMSKLEARIESQTVSGFNAVHRRLDELYQALLHARK